MLKLDDNNVELKLYVPLTTHSSSPSFSLRLLHVPLSLFYRPDSRTLTVHMSNVQLSSSLQRGDIVSFSYEKLSKTSLPVDPKIYKIRRDISWTDVIQSSKAQEPNSMLLHHLGEKGEEEGEGKQTKEPYNSFIFVY